MKQTFLSLITLTCWFTSCGPQINPSAPLKDIGLTTGTQTTLIHYNAQVPVYEVWKCREFQIINFSNDCLLNGRKIMEYPAENFSKTLVRLLLTHQNELIRANHRSWVQIAGQAILDDEMTFLVSEQSRLTTAINKARAFIRTYKDEIDDTALEELQKLMNEKVKINDRFAEINIQYKKVLELTKNFIDLIEDQNNLFYKELSDNPTFSLMFTKLVDGFPVLPDMKFSHIPAGNFWMGLTSGEEGGSSQHQVTISSEFEMQTTEVTQSQWVQIMGNNPAFHAREQDCPMEHRSVHGIAFCPSFPVEQVSWYDAQRFIAKVNEIDTRFRYRLPTEAEWEYAVSFKTNNNYLENNLLNGIAWYQENAGGRTHAAGQLNPNIYGLYDVLGNVCEWTADWWGDYPTAHVIDPKGPDSGTHRIYRGGGWGNDYFDIRTGGRASGLPDRRLADVGFRLLRVVR